MSIKELAQHAASDPKVGHVVAAATTGSGIAGLFDWVKVIPLSEIATVVGIILSSVLIYTHWRKGRIEYEKTRLEIDILKLRAGMHSKDTP